MASGPGRARGGIRIQEPGDRQREESNAAAAAAAAAAGPPPPDPPSDGLQERPHGSSGAAGRSPSAAAAARKGKGVLAPSSPPSPTRSEGTSPPVSSEIVYDKRAGGSSSANTLADGDRRLGVSWKNPLVEATTEGPTRHFDLKAFDILSLEEQWALAEEMEREQRQQAQERKSLWNKFKGGMANMGKSPALKDKKLLWREFLDRIGYSNRNYTEPQVNYQKVQITELIRHYNLLELVAGLGAEFHPHVLNLPRAYSEFRPVLGDGECFYRSFIFSYLEQVLDRKDTHEEHRLLAAVKGVSRQNARLGWASEFSRSHKAFKKLIKKVMRWKTHRRWKHVPTTDSYRMEKLLEFFSNHKRTDDIFTFLRLVAAIWICSHSEEFEPLIPALNEDYTLIEWCFREVIQRKVYTDHIQITALARALRVPLRVEYLFRGAGQDIYTGQDSQDDMSRSTGWPRRHHQVPPDHEVPRVTVLYMPEHYDILYPYHPDGPVTSDKSSGQRSDKIESSRSGETSQPTDWWVARLFSLGEKSNKDTAEGGN